MPAYYNEFDPFAAEWLRQLVKHGHIAAGDVDERSIEAYCEADAEAQEEIAKYGRRMRKKAIVL